MQKMQIWLTVVVQGTDVVTLVLPPNTDAMIGRDESACDVVLHHPNVSRVHARIIARPTGYTVQDVASKIGTNVNGRRIDDRRFLMSGDVIGLGPYDLRVTIRPWVHRDESALDTTLSEVEGVPDPEDDPGD